MLLPLLLMATIASPAGQQAPAANAELDALLAQPLSPGTVALLVEQPTDPRVQRRLTEALADANPAVRSIAARVVLVTGSKGQTPGLVRALSKETDADAGSEELRALLTFLGAAADEQGLAAVKRLGRVAAETMTTVLARRGTDDLLTQIPALRQALGTYGSFASALVVATVQHPASATGIARAALADDHPMTWDGYLEGLRESAVSVDESVLLDALKSTDERMRTLSVWHVTLAVMDGDGFSDEVLKAVAPAAPGSGPAGGTGYGGAAPVTWEDFGREILARVQGRPASTADWAGLITANKQWSIPAEVYAYMTKPEVAAMGVVRADKEAGRLKQTMRTGRREQKDVRARTMTTRTFDVFAPGLAAGLMETTGCRPAVDGRFVAGEFTYREDGRPKSVRVIDEGVSKACQRVGRVAMVLSIASAGQPVDPNLTDIVLFLFERSFLACADAPRAPWPPRVEAYTLPAVKKKVSYEWSPAMSRRQLDGVVRLAAAISQTGCVRYVETRRSLEPIYDLATIQAMKQWEFVPASADGAPVESRYNVAFEVAHH
jgi:hypothetical protein